MRRAHAAVGMVCGVLCVLSPVAAATPRFVPRIAGAFGIVPPAGHQELAVGTSLPVVYHGGPVIRNVTLHTIFWAPKGYAFDGPLAGSILGYEQLIQQFLSDSAHDSGAPSNVFSILPQYADNGGPGTYGIHYDASTDSIDASDPYPRAGSQCASPAGIATCVTDLQLEREIDHVIQSRDRGARGLSNVWLIFLPPDVDTCILPGSCATNAFGGYHSLFERGHGVTVYSSIPDPLIETTIGPGSDPEGNPDGEAAVDVVAHETAEAITDPKGDGWMDPNGNEVGDKCEIGPPRGRPLGFAANGSPYNQLIDGNQYLLQAMWSNAASGCVQRSSDLTSRLPIAHVRLTQFDSSISGKLGTLKPGTRVTVSLLRTGTEVARASATVVAGGRWGPVRLDSSSLRSRHAFGDDRDEVDVFYGNGQSRPDVILTGAGGNPFGAAGWTGWFDLDDGFAVASGRNRGVIALEPCSQTGVLRLTIDGVPTPSPVDTCETESGASIVRTKALPPATAIGMSSTDNRAVSPANTDGALVTLVVPIGEPNSISSLGNPLVPIQPSGFPSCSGDLQAGFVRCSGLVPGARYTITRSRGRSTVHARAQAAGSLRASGFRGAPALTGGDVLRLVNGAGRTLTVLHLGHLRVHINGGETQIASGSCEAGDYYGAALKSPPVASGIGHGVDGTGTICPLSGDATGLPAGDIEQTDDLSGGQTSTEVPQIVDTSPTQDATIYGRFVALAGAAFAEPNGTLLPSRARISLTITRSSRQRVLIRCANVNTAPGVRVRALPAGVYAARWVLTDANGDTRTVQTRFVEA